MNKIFTLSILLMFCSNLINAQVFRNVDPVICPIDHNRYDTFVPPSARFTKQYAQRSIRQNNATFIVNYNGFTPEAEAAFQYAVDIWASLIKSPVPIIVNANFIELGDGVLGSAGPSTVVRDFEGSPVDTTFYPIALAEKLAGKNLNTPDGADINSNFSSTFPFYFGLDGNPPSSEFDFVSIVLHELGHGLGFTGLVTFDNTVDPQIGSWDLVNSGKSSIFTKYAELGDGSLLTSLPTEGGATTNALISNDLFFNAPLTVVTLGERAKLFAPSAWNGGSSFSHLDENEFPAGDPNSLMSPSFGRGEAIHDPGVSLDMFADMGWVHTYLRHDNSNLQVTENFVDDITVNLSIESDTSLASLSPQVIYTLTNFNEALTIPMTDSGDGINFIASIPNPGQKALIKYYFSGVQDGLGRSYTSPYNAPFNYYEINFFKSPAKSVPYSTTDGGNFTINPNDFNSYALNGTINLWERGQPANVLNETVGDVDVWKTKLASNIENFPKDYSSALVSPSFDFSDDLKDHKLSFQFAMENAVIGAGSFFENGPIAFNVEYSLDNGVNWSILGESGDEAGINWYNKDEISFLPEDSNSGWIKQTIEIDGEDTTFVSEKATYNVSFLTGNSLVNFRIIAYVSSNFNSLGYEADGVLIDNFEVLQSAPTAEFKSSTSDIAFIGDEIEFEYISTGATDFTWDFGDGNTSSLRNPTHSYMQGGEFDVSLTIISPDGTDQVVKQNYIRVIPVRPIPYTLNLGGNLETTDNFNIINVSGTKFEYGNSSIAGKAGAASGSSAIVLGIDEAEYVNDSKAFIYSPEFNFSILGPYQLSFKANYLFEDGWDGFIIEYTLDRGASWEQLNATVEDDWYDRIGEDNPEQGWPAIPLFTGTTDNAFVTKTNDISDLAGGKSIIFRVHFMSDAAEVEVGMAFDDFEISGPLAGPIIGNIMAESLSGCIDDEITFINKSIGSIAGVKWEFGEGASPATAETFGPHQVSYSTAGNKDITLTLTDSLGMETIVEEIAYIEIGEKHTPTFIAGERNEDYSRILTASAGDSYQWFYEGDSIVDATEQTFLASPTESGNYSVSTSINGCVANSGNERVVTANNSPLNRTFSIFPNPISNNSNIQFNFRNEYLGIYEIEVISISGGRLYAQRIEKSSFETSGIINTSDLSPGLYIVKVLVGDEFSQRKFIVE